MSHSSGIPVSEQLRTTFGKALEDQNVRLIKCIIQEEQVVDVQTQNLQSDWETDLELVQPLLEKDNACYVIYRTDIKGAVGYNWLLFCFVPDLCKVKEKMLFASTRANVKQQLGLSFFSDDIFGTVPSDFNKKGMEIHMASKKMEAPLTEQEQLKQREHGEIYKGGASTYVHGVAFPIVKEASETIEKLINGQVNYVRIAIDCDNEKITTDGSATLGGFNDIASQIPTDEPRFHLFAYDHQHEGTQFRSYVFIFSCPDGSRGTKSAPVRMRMLYSTSKANVTNILSTYNASVDAKFEINTAEDVTEEMVLETLHPKPVEAVKTFAKPSRPGKGGARLHGRDKKE